MPDAAYIQYGSFGLIVFVTVWFVRTGFPRMMEVVESSITRVLAKIDAIESRCADEREANLQAFREEQQLGRIAFATELKAMRACMKEEGDADREARHKTANDFTEIIAQVFIKHGIKPGI